MRSLKNVRFALDGDSPNWSVRNSVASGIWPKLSTDGTNNISIAELCKRFSNAGHELRILANGDTNCWQHISRGNLVTALRHRIRNPGVIQQKPTDLCGPIAVLMEFARRHPALYVRGAAELLHDGQFTPIAGDVIVAEEDLRAQPVPDGDISSADWIYAATMRDAENVSQDVDDGQGAEGFTLWWAMITWTQDLLGLDTYYYNCWSAGEMDTLRHAQSDVHAGGVAFLLVDNGLIHKRESATVETPLGSVPVVTEWLWNRHRAFKVEGGPFDGDFSEPVRCEQDGLFPNHWVVLLGGLSGSRSHNDFKVRHWSFGKEWQNTGNSEGFGEYLYGVVAGKLP